MSNEWAAPPAYKPEKQDKTYIIFFNFSDMHLHAYSKANYQTNVITISHSAQITNYIWHSCTNQDQEHVFVSVSMRNRSRVEEQNNILLWVFKEDCRLQPYPPNQIKWSFSNWHRVKIPFRLFTYLVDVHLICLSGLNRADHWAVMTGISKTLWKREKCWKRILTSSLLSSTDCQQESQELQ